MKTILVAIFLFLLGLPNSRAQQQTEECVDLSIEIKTLCHLAPVQKAKAQPIVVDFEKKRDSIYTIYRNNPEILHKEVMQNKWNYETHLTSVLTPTQMGLVKAFDQKNMEAMTHNCRKINKVDYLRDSK
ncbi:MAG TPA: hypothetical protein VK808_04040 [Bacteroidia bacterium]|nr:hypothetical protein [Bacteroidia bacterium]